MAACAASEGRLVNGLSEPERDQLAGLLRRLVLSLDSNPMINDRKGRCPMAP